MERRNLRLGTGSEGEVGVGDFLGYENKHRNPESGFRERTKRRDPGRKGLLSCTIALSVLTGRTTWKGSPDQRRSIVVRLDYFY